MATAPRVRVSDAPGGPDRPFLIGVLADLGGSLPFPQAGFRPVRRDDFDDVLRQIGPRLKLQLFDRGDPVAIELQIGRMAGFAPDEVARQVPGHLLHVVLKHPDFLRLEGAWRGLHYVVEQAAPDDLVQVVVLDSRRAAVADDLAADGAGLLLDLVADDGPCGLIVADYEVDVRRADGVELLRCLAELGASVHAPVIAATAPGTFGLETWSELPRLRDPQKVFQSVEYAAWKSFRESPESRFVALALPRVLARAGAGDAVDADERSPASWMGAGWAYAAVAARAFRMDGWFAHTRGGADGVAPGLPPQHVYLGQPQAVEGNVFDREAAFGVLGFLPAVQTGAGDVAFFGAQSCHKPPTYTDEAANRRAAASTRLDVILSAGRFVQAMTDVAAAQMVPKAELSRRLANWLAEYLGTSAEKPLGKAEIELKSGPGNTTVAVLRLRLDFQFPEPVDISVGVPVTVRG